MKKFIRLVSSNIYSNVLKAQARKKHPRDADTFNDWQLSLSKLTPSEAYLWLLTPVMFLVLVKMAVSHPNCQHHKDFSFGLFLKNIWIEALSLFLHSDLGLILKSLQLYQRLGLNQSSLAHKVTPRTGKLLSDFCMQGSNNDCLMVERFSYDLEILFR